MRHRPKRAARSQQAGGAGGEGIDLADDSPSARHRCGSMAASGVPQGETARAVGGQRVQVRLFWAGYPGGSRLQ